MKRVMSKKINWKILYLLEHGRIYDIMKSENIGVIEVRQ